MRNISSVLIAAAVLAAAAGVAVAGRVGTQIVWQDRHSALRGTSVTVPAGWKKGDDSSFSMNVNGPDRNAQNDTGSKIIFFADPIATAGGPKPTKLSSVGTTPAALVAWLRHNPKLVVSTSTIRAIGGGLRALSVDLHVSPSAGKEDPHCTVACWSYFIFRTGCCYGTGANSYVRLYFASVGKGSNQHVLAISIEGTPRSAFTAVLPTAKTILDTLKLPAGLRPT
jgi:hypothetical protein